MPDHATIGKIGADSRKRRGRFFTPSREDAGDNCGLLLYLVPGKARLDPIPSVDPLEWLRREGKERNEEEGRRVGDDAAVGSSR